MKRIFILFLSACLLLLLPLSLVSCSSRAPELDEIYDRVVELVEASYALNSVFYGAGLPYYDRSLSVYDFLYSDYSTVSYTKDYNIVSDRAMYPSVDAIKLAASQIYTPTLLEETVYPWAFDGVVLPGVSSGAQFSPALYQEGSEDFYIHAGDREAPPTPRVYDYATMKIIRPSNSERVLLTLQAWEEDAPVQIATVTLSVALVDGIWLLDSLTV